MKYKYPAYKKKVLIFTTFIIGGFSLLLICLFLFFGAFSPVNFGMNNIQALVFNSFLCFLFFIQHSILIRKSIRIRIEQRIDADYFGSFYSISSGCILFILVILWQNTFLIASAGKLLYWILRALFVISVFGFYWGVKSLESFDPFGIERIKLADAKRKSKPAILTIKGAYLWIRHPLYFFSLLMIWSIPDLTADRLLFNILWTIWIIIATKLEERDLLMDFGKKYKQYMDKVPMLIPYKLNFKINKID
jgi:methanethiol S-methyltransferase